MACAVGVESLRVMEDDGVLERVRDLGERVVRPFVEDLAQRHPVVGAVRGVGLFWAIELVRDRESREPLVPFNAAGEANAPMVEFAAACKARGLWPFMHFNRVHVAPPLVISEEELVRGLQITDEALGLLDQYVK